MQTVRQRALALELRPQPAGDDAGVAALRHVLPGHVVVGDPVIKVLAVHVHADAEDALDAAHVLRPFVPELGNFLIAGVRIEAPFEADDGERRFFNDAIIQHGSALQTDFDVHPGKGAQRRAGLPSHRRRDAVETLERLGEAVGGIVAVLQRRVNDLDFAACQLLGRQRHPARADVFADGQAAQRPEDALIIERRQRGLGGDFFNVQILRQVVLDEVDGRLKPFDPALHAAFLLPFA